MKKKNAKWRELVIDPQEIKFKKINFHKIVGYFPASNDVTECVCNVDSCEKNFIIKIERSNMADFATEVKHITILSDNKYYNKLPEIVEEGNVKGKKYIVLEKITGKRLSEIFQNDIHFKKEYLIKYGKELAVIHSIPSNKFGKAKQRSINESPNEEKYSKFDKYILPYIEFLKNNLPVFNHETFIHGDFHYANLLWRNKKISGVLDFEYSGKGYKEQDIAWACILRPTQKFMDNLRDIFDFLEGYLLSGTFNHDNFKWCLINGLCHFYLMNKENEIYKEKTMKLLSDIFDCNFA